MQDVYEVSYCHETVKYTLGNRRSIPLAAWASCNAIICSVGLPSAKREERTGRPPHDFGEGVPFSGVFGRSQDRGHRGRCAAVLTDKGPPSLLPPSLPSPFGWALRGAVAGRRRAWVGSVRAGFGPFRVPVLALSRDITTVPTAGFEPATHGLGNRRSIP